VCEDVHVRAKTFGTLIGKFTSVRGEMFATVSVTVLGVIENISYFIAPDTGNRHEIFGSGGAIGPTDSLASCAGLAANSPLPISPRSAAYEWSGIETNR
jgi:NUBPL iron-transfer P-loop NTPase